MAAIGPMFARFGFFHQSAGKDDEDKRPHARYRAEIQCLPEVLETRFEGRSWIMGEDYPIADIALLGWGRHLVGFHHAGERVGYPGLNNVPAWLKRGLARAAVQRGLAIPVRSE